MALSLALVGCHSEAPPGAAASVEPPAAPAAAAPPASAAVEPGPDPRVAQREMLAAAEALLQRDGSALSMADYVQLEARLREMRSDTEAADAAHLALALLYEFHAPDAVFPAASDAADGGVLDDGRSRARVLAALAALELAVRSNPANIAALWQLALLQENVDDKLAVQQWQQLVKQAPEHLQALTRLGEGLLLVEDHEGAGEVGKQALRIALLRGDEEEAGRARNVLGRVYLQQGRYALAEEMLKDAAVRTDGSHWGCAYQSLGQLYATLGDSELPDINDTSDQAAVAAALSAYQRDDYEAALRHIDAALAKAPRDELAVMRGFLLFFEGRDEQARRLFEEAMGSNPTDPGPGTGLAHLAIASGDYGRAAQLLQPALVSWHKTRVSSKDLPRYYAFLHRLACLANGFIQVQRQASGDESAGAGEAGSGGDPELARVVCAMDLGFGGGPDAAAPAWIEARAAARALR